ncbi:glycosyltransferase family 39 protein [Streptosporangiaceae bacterium NEAU-GS5]|nr:glycosyltransferase family 39 protein [Streptosporangiaceae bacterium NEAU-GS5]
MGTGRGVLQGCWERRDRVAPRLPAALALVVGLIGIDRPSMWQHEATTYVLASRPLPQLWLALANVDAVHGAFYLLIHLLLSAAGSLAPPEVLSRLPSALATAAAALGVAAVGRAAATLTAGVCAGTVFALSPVICYYAQEGRSPALVAASVVAATYALVRAAGTPERWGWWAGYATAITAGCLLNLFAALALAAHAITLVAWRTPWPVLVRWASAGALGLACAAPVAWVASGQQGQIAGLTRPTWTTVGALITRFAGAGLLLALIIAMAVVAVARRPLAGLTAVALPLALVPPAVLLAVSQIHPYFQDRYVLYAVAGVAWLAGSGIATAASLTSRKASKVAGVAAGGVALILVGVLVLAAQAQVRRLDSRRDDPASAARILAAEALPGDAVVYLPSVRRIVAEAYPGDFRLVRDAALKTTGAESGTLAGRELSGEEIAASLATAPRVWVISRTHATPESLDSAEDQTKQYLLRENYRQAQRTEVLGYAVRLYVRTPTS